MDGVAASSFPPDPPQTEADVIDRLRLLRSHRVGIVTYYRLMAEHGSARAALDALPSIAAQAGLDGYHVCDERSIRAELRAGRKVGARLLWAGGPDYPWALLDINDPPPALWALGAGKIGHRSHIALIGARNASSLGLRMAHSLAADLGAMGHCVISGLARGVDAAAHKGALETGTIAVVGGGVDVIYPRENAALRARILETGLIVSEQPMGLAPKAQHFPRRNRLISGLSRAVIVVEAAAKSGSLMTARIALDQGKEVMAVPGHPFDARAAGCNMLIRDGAALIRNGKDIADALGPMPMQSPLPAPATSRPPDNTRSAKAQDASPLPHVPAGADPTPPASSSPPNLPQQILARLSQAPVAQDVLMVDLCASTAQITAALLELELDGQIERSGGGTLQRITS